MPFYSSRGFYAHRYFYYIIFICFLQSVFHMIYRNYLKSNIALPKILLLFFVFAIIKSTQYYHYIDKEGGIIID